MLTGKAKTDYQREYMRLYRSNAIPVRPSVSVRPPALDPVRPNLARGATINMDRAENVERVLTRVVLPPPKAHIKPEPQSHNPMMVGYVPPQD